MAAEVETGKTQYWYRRLTTGENDETPGHPYYDCPTLNSSAWELPVGRQYVLMPTPLPPPGQFPYTADYPAAEAALLSSQPQERPMLFDPALVSGDTANTTAGQTLYDLTDDIGTLGTRNMEAMESDSDPGMEGSVDSGTGTRCSVQHSESSDEDPDQAFPQTMFEILQGSIIVPEDWAHGTGPHQMNLEAYYDRLRLGQIPLAEAEDSTLARRTYNRPCEDCGLLTGNWSEGTAAGYRFLASRWIPSETWGANQVIPLCSICDRHFPSCHCCRTVAWCRPAERN